MDGNDDLFRSFSRLGNEIVAERDRRLAEGAWERDIAFDLLSMIVRHYHEEYCPRTNSRSCLDNLLGPYPWDAGASAVPTEVIREQILARCDQELDPVPEKVVAALRGEYLTFLWRTLRDRDVVPEPRDQEKDDEKIRSTLVGLGFNEPYSPRWGFSYICRELETARNALSCVDDSFVDAKTIEVIRDNTILVLKSYKRFVQMLLSFYGQHAFGGARQLVATLKPEISQSDKYLKTCRLGDLIELLVQLGEHAQKESDRQQPFWQEFLNVVFIKQDLIAQLQQVCHETFSRLKTSNRAAYKIEEAFDIGTRVIPGLVDHLLGARDDYRASFPLVIALKASRRYEDGRTRIDYLDEMGQWGFVRKDIGFRWRSDYYFRPRPGKSPIILPVENWHQDFILRHDRPIQTQLDDTDLRILFDKLEKCRNALEGSGLQQVVSSGPIRTTSPLAKLGISQDGEIFDEEMLVQAIRRALQEGETDMIEFKAGPSEDDEIARELAALANTKGGVLVFGLPDDPTVGSRQWNKAVTGREKLQSREFRNNFFARIDKIAKGAPGQFYYCFPPVVCVPHPKSADRYLDGAKGDIIITVVLPIPEGGDLCAVTGSVIYIRLRGSCEQATPIMLKTYDNSGKKLWMQ